MSKKLTLIFQRELVEWILLINRASIPQYCSTNDVYFNKLILKLLHSQPEPVEGDFSY